MTEKQRRRRRLETNPEASKDEIKSMSPFEIFALFDDDDSGLIDGYELQQALRSADIADLPPWDIAKLMQFIDIDGDGRVNLPELDIAIARVRSGATEEE